MHKEEILQIAHMQESSDLARKYFDNRNIQRENINLKQYQELTKFIQKEIDLLLVDTSYKMIPRLKMINKIKQSKDSVNLCVKGSYFNKREAITFFTKGGIIFCPWASGCNRIPFINGFVKWCDWMEKT
jgi:hypothetical protein